MKASRHQTGKVGHVDHELRANLARDFGERLELDDARVSAGSGDDQFRLLLTGDLLHPRVVDASVVADAVVNGVIEQSREVDGRAVGEMSALGEIEAEHDVAGLEKREVYSGIGLRSRMRLDVGVIGAEKLLQTIDGELLHHVYELTTAVVALSRQSFRVLVRERRAHRLQHRWRDEVLTGD